MILGFNCAIAGAILATAGVGPADWQLYATLVVVLSAYVIGIRKGDP